MTTGDGTGGNDEKLGWRVPKTRWSLVLAAGKPDGNAARNEFCRMYRPSVVAFLCRLGCSRQEADDNAQEFFTRMLARNDLARVQHTTGKFRSWLCVCVKRYFFNERKRERAARRWSGQLDAEFDETAFRSAPNAHGILGTEATLDRIWDQCWAHEVMQRALARLREHRHCSGRMALYEELCDPSLRDALKDPEKQQREALLAHQFGIKINSVRASRNRLQLAFVECLDAEIALTLDPACSLREERSRLIQAFSSTEGVLAKHSDVGLPPPEQPPFLLN